MGLISGLHLPTLGLHLPPMGLLRGPQLGQLGLQCYTLDV